MRHLTEQRRQHAAILPRCGDHGLGAVYLEAAGDVPSRSRAVRPREPQIGSVPRLDQEHHLMLGQLVWRCRHLALWEVARARHQNPSYVTDAPGDDLRAVEVRDAELHVPDGGHFAVEIARAGNCSTRPAFSASAGSFALRDNADPEL